jgi:hypothetical protein
MYRLHGKISRKRRPRKALFVALVLLVIVVGSYGLHKHTQRTSAKPPAGHSAVKSIRASQSATAKKNDGVLLSEPLNGPDQIVTNEFVHYNPGDGCPYTSSVWDMTSGSLLIKNNAGYSGVPTVEKTSQCDSTVHNNSAVFRLKTKESDFKNVKVSMDFMPVAHGGGGASSNSYDGIHIWVGYQSEYSLYAATIFRWDNDIVIKKKVPASQAKCTDVSNDGCYFNVSKTVQNPETAQVWHHVDVTDTVDAQGVVHIATSVDGKLVATGVDNSVGGAPYPSGAVGVRGDNTEFYFKNFTVTQL